MMFLLNNVFEMKNVFDLICIQFYAIIALTKENTFFTGNIDFWERSEI